jgi:glycosyltransferase involved in cell wall biosynthesis
LRPILLNNSNIKGGASRAAYGLHTGLKQIGVDSYMIGGIQVSGDTSVIGPSSLWGRGMGIAGPLLDNLPLKVYRKRKSTHFSPACLSNGLAKKAALLNSDIIHLHWICGGFLRIETLKKFHKPIVWTLHDMWPFTGGCHYDESCGRYRDSCGICPQLNSERQKDLSHWVWKRKKKAWKNLDLTIVTPSRWLADCAKESSLFSNHRVEVIPNGLDVVMYKPVDKDFARECFGLPKDKKLILFGAMNVFSDRRKGFQFLEPALNKLMSDGLGDKAELVLFGASEPANQPHLRLNTHYVGKLHDDVSLAMLYAAVDVFVSASLQEAFGLTIAESISCGTPVVAFNTTGPKDIVEHKRNGYLAEPCDVGDLAKGIAWVLGDGKRRQILSRQARQKVEQEFELKYVAQRYLDLYEEILSSR